MGTGIPVPITPDNPRVFYKLGLSANTSGLSLYVMGLKDKSYLPAAYGSRLGKAKITGYCIRFRSLKDVDLAALDELIADALGAGPAALRPRATVQGALV